jgi:hypothetical protein
VGGEKDLYGILQVEETADETMITKQYRRIALSTHPDKNCFAGAQEAFKLVVPNRRLVCQTWNKIFSAYCIEDQEPMPAKQTDHYLVVGMGLWVLQFLLISAYFRHPDYRGNYVELLNKFLS